MQPFVCFLLVGLLLAFCTRESSAQCVNHGHIKGAPGSLSKCDQLYTIMEEALVSDSENLFALRRTFYPQTGLPAPLLCVNYNITSDDELLANGSTNIQISIKRSTSSLFSVINPYVLLEFVSGYILVFVETNLDAEEMAISLDVIDMLTPIRATDQEMIETLEILTTRLEAYAKEQGKLTDWDGTGRGYTWEYEYLSQWFWLFLIGDIFLSVFAISLAPQIYFAIKSIVVEKVRHPTSKKSVKKASGQESRQAEEGGAQGDDADTPQLDSEQGSRQVEEDGLQDADADTPADTPRIMQVGSRRGSRQAEEGGAQEGTSHDTHVVSKVNVVFYIFAFVLVVICLLEFACSIYIIARAASICPNKSCLEEVVPTRIAILCFIAIAAFVGSFIFGTVSGNLSKNEGFIEKFKHSAKEFFTIAGFFAVFLLLAVNVIPTIILGFIFPFEVITGIVYLPMIGIIVLLYTEVSSYIISDWKKNIIHDNERKKDDKKVLHMLYWLFNIFIIILFVSVATVIFVFSFTVHKAEVHPSFVSTIIPPIILFLLTTLAKKYVIDKYDPPQEVSIKECVKAIPVLNKDTPASPLNSPMHHGDGHQPLLQ